MLENSIPIKVNVNNSDYGFGRLCTLKNKISIDEAVQRVKKHTNLEYIRLARAFQTGIEYFFYFSYFFLNLKYYNIIFF